jgi:long-chain acyl-CoA synthetase
MEITRVFDILTKLESYSPKQDIINAKEHLHTGQASKQWVHYSVADFINYSNYVSAAMLQIGLTPGDKVAVMASNMPKWNFVDYGSQQVAMPVAPIFPTISNNDLKYILNHCEAKIIFISDNVVYQKIMQLRHELIHLKHIYSFNVIEGVPSFLEFTTLGKQHLDLEKINRIKNQITENDLLTILYTSGTTGEPKGVMISHKNLMSNVKTCKDLAPFTRQWKAISFLPLNHVYERFINTLYLFHGVSIYYAESFETIGDNCREIQPQIFVAVPRILERVLEKISEAGKKLKGLKKIIFNWSMALAERYELNRENGFWYECQRKIADALVYKKWREALGSKVVLIVSGGAALNPKLEKIFHCANLILLQGYGLTETCVVISVNRFEPENRMFGTVGLVVDNSSVKIAEEDGEILMKGPSLMMGYYKNEEATNEVIDDEGWFHTGDVGKLVNGTFLKIIDRKKEIFKNSGGKYISPIAIENKLKESIYIEQCMVIGEGQKFVSALIIPSLTSFKTYCSENSIEWLGNEVMYEHKALKQIMVEHIKKVNETLAPFEQLKRYQFILANWGVESGEITPKLSLRRKAIMEKNMDVINKIFGNED